MTMKFSVHSEWGAKQEGRELDLFGQPDTGKGVTGTDEQPSLFDNLANPKVATTEGKKQNGKDERTKYAE